MNIIGKRIQKTGSKNWVQTDLLFVVFGNFGPLVFHVFDQFGRAIDLLAGLDELFFEGGAVRAQLLHFGLFFGVRRHRPRRRRRPPVGGGVFAGGGASGDGVGGVGSVGAVGGVARRRMRRRSALQDRRDATQQRAEVHFVFDAGRPARVLDTNSPRSNEKMKLRKIGSQHIVSTLIWKMCCSWVKRNHLPLVSWVTRLLSSSGIVHCCGWNGKASLGDDDVGSHLREAVRELGLAGLRQRPPQFPVLATLVLQQLTRLLQLRPAEHKFRPSFHWCFFLHSDWIIWSE